METIALDKIEKTRFEKPEWSSFYMCEECNGTIFDSQIEFYEYCPYCGRKVIKKHDEFTLHARVR